MNTFPINKYKIYVFIVVDSPTVYYRFCHWPKYVLPPNNDISGPLGGLSGSIRINQDPNIVYTIHIVSNILTNILNILSK